MKLWEIELELDKLFLIPDTDEVVNEETGEVLNKTYLDELIQNRDKAVKNICKYVKEIDGNLETADKEVKRLNAIKKTLKNRQDSLKKYLASVLDGEKWEADDYSCKVGWRMSKDVVTIDDVKAIPEEYFKRPQYESNLDKTAVKEAIKGGKVIAGVHLQDNNNIQIK